MKVAVLDLYNRVANEGMRGLRTLLEEFRSVQEGRKIQYDIYDVRHAHQIPGLEYDAYISSGGPGNPDYRIDPENIGWGERWSGWIRAIMDHNAQKGVDKKSVFLICHSFQMMCLEMKVARVELRYSPSFGIFPMHKTPDGLKESLFMALDDPFYAVDSRSYQVVEPDKIKMNERGVKILAYEKIRPHVPFDRAIMAIRFTPEIIGTQFHPEADDQGMARYFNRQEKKEEIVDQHGLAKYEDMVRSLADPDRMAKTFQTLIPAFLQQSLTKHNPISS